jgi:hypothetical protein
MVMQRDAQSRGGKAHRAGRLQGFREYRLALRAGAQPGIDHTIRVRVQRSGLRRGGFCGPDDRWRAVGDSASDRATAA